jgi:hypothetical protein
VAIQSCWEFSSSSLPWITKLKIVWTKKHFKSLVIYVQLQLAKTDIGPNSLERYIPISSECPKSKCLITENIWLNGGGHLITRQVIRLLSNH